MNEVEMTVMAEERFITRLSKSHLESIFSWCPPYEKERILNHNKPSVGGAMAMFIGQEAVAYLYYRELSRDVARIEFIEVNQKLRRQGVGKRFMEQAFNYFYQQKGYKVIDVNCVTIEGLIHAKKLGFRKYCPPSDFFNEKSHNDHGGPDYKLYRSLEPSVPLRPYRKGATLCLAVWTNNPSGEGDPDRYYDMTADNNIPLVDYLHYDWYVGVMKDGVTLRPEKVKRFFRNYHQLSEIVFLTPQDIMGVG